MGDRVKGANCEALGQKRAAAHRGERAKDDEDREQTNPPEAAPNGRGAETHPMN